MNLPTPTPGPMPAPDDRLVASGTRHEVEDGRIVHGAPADEPHGTRHSKLSALLEAHAADDYDVACDMLTRLSLDDDQAPDASVFPREREADTGGRKLEELAFEVVSTQRLAKASTKAAKLLARGVRRAFAIDVVRERVLEWSTDLGSWSPMLDTAFIDDRCLAVPLPIAALVRVTKADDAVARALLHKGNPVLGQALAVERQAGEARGEARALARAVLEVLSARGLRCPDDVRARVSSCEDVAILMRWLGRAATAARVADVVESPTT